MEYQSSSLADERFPWKSELVVTFTGRAVEIDPPASCPLPASFPVDPKATWKMSIWIVYCPDPMYWSIQM